MNVSPSAEYQQSLEEFRQLLFHLQMQVGSVHDLFQYFKEEESMEHFEALKAIDPNLMSQLLVENMYWKLAIAQILTMPARTWKQPYSSIQLALRLCSNWQ